jgi:RNA polymerase sigma-70 factor (ECF subfamily)
LRTVTDDGPKSASDDALMGQFCAGDEAAFEMLYQRHSTTVLAFLKRMVRDEALAEDLLQTTFVSFVRARGRYVPGTSVRSWVFAIAANAGRDALRRRKASPERLVAEGAAPEPRTEPAVSDPAAARLLQDALMRLPVDQREAVVLHKLEELPFEEVAAALGITVSAAKVRAHRGYVRLRQILEPLGGAT